MSSLPETGPISLGQLQTEFGGTNPAGLGEYYKGGNEVPDTGATSKHTSHRQPTNCLTSMVHRMSV